MTLTLRAIQPEDARGCGQIAFAAHHSVASAHSFPPELPSVEFAIGLINAKLRDPNAYGFLAERDGQIVGSIFLNTFAATPVAVIGPLSVHPSAEGGVGRQLMDVALEVARSRGFERVRLVQSPGHLRSLALYTKRGFVAREPLVLMQGAPPVRRQGNGRVRRATPGDLVQCNVLCAAVHGISRPFELETAIQQNIATVVERSDQITGYAAGIGFRGHAVAETTNDLLDLISNASAFLGPGFFVPIRNTTLLSELLEAGLRALWPATLMTVGPYQEPQGAYLPSIAF